MWLPENTNRILLWCYREEGGGWVASEPHWAPRLLLLMLYDKLYKSLVFHELMILFC